MAEIRVGVARITWGSKTCALFVCVCVRVSVCSGVYACVCCAVLTLSLVQHALEVLGSAIPVASFEGKLSHDDGCCVITLVHPQHGHTLVLAGIQGLFVKVQPCQLQVGLHGGRVCVAHC